MKIGDTLKVISIAGDKEVVKRVRITNLEINGNIVKIETKGVLDIVGADMLVCEQQKRMRD